MGAGRTCLLESCGDFSSVGVSPYFVLYAEILRCTSLSKKLNPRRKNLLAGCPDNPLASHIFFGRLFV